MQLATLGILVRGEREVLLGLKKIGFGAGKYAGFGGKIESGETPVRAAARELEEETGVVAIAADLELVGQLTFQFPAKPAWDQVVFVFLVRAWEGEPVESDEMRPRWFGRHGLPFAQMWQDAEHWLPRILNGQLIQARFTFGDDNESVQSAEIAETVFG